MLRPFSLLMFVVAGGMAFGQAPPGPSSPTNTARLDPPITVIRLANPSGKSVIGSPLMPNLLDMTATNAAPQWLRAALEERVARQKWTDQANQWNSAEFPLAKLPIKEVQTFLQPYQGMIRTAQLASRCKFCDWGIPPLTIQTISHLQLEDIQSMRAVARVLSLQARLQIAEGKLDEALRTIQIGLALSHHVSQGDTVIGGLVAVAVGAIFLGRLEELVQQPGAGNLYWALTQLPAPLADCRHAMRQEMNVFARSFPALRQANSKPMSVEQANQLGDDLIRSLQEVQGIVGKDVPAASNWGGRLALATISAKVLPDAKKSLLAQGLTPEQIEAMPALQVVFLYLQTQYEQIKDDILKWLALPSWQGRAGFISAARSSGKILRETNPLLALLLPAFEKVYEAQTRLEWQFAALRTAEAIRLYAATHGGKPPAKLADITEVPLPINPHTGRDFGDAYRLVDGVGVLEAIPQLPVVPGFGRRFELAPSNP